MRIPDFTKPEIDFLLENCNFLPEEEILFIRRCRNHTLEEIAEELNVSYKTAYRINKRVKNKIIKVI